MTEERKEFENKYNYLLSTPMMQQYLDIKFDYKDTLLLFRMGDFYELFHEDALIASRVLGIALAKRGKVENEYIPMCGVPHHALENYMNKLLEEGYKIAICDQKETPEEAKKRGGYKAVVKRDVVRVITPGTVVEPNILDSVKPNYLISINEENSEIAIAYCDISTSEFIVSKMSERMLESELNRINPSEILLPQKIQKNILLSRILSNYSLKLVYQVDHSYEIKKSIRQIENIYKITSYKSIGSFSNNELSAIGVLLQYLSITQKENIPKLPYPKYHDTGSYMVIDSTTRKSLEITETLSGSRKGSLLASIDRTVTKGGARLLYKYLNAPLANSTLIKERLNLTKFFFDNKQIRDYIRETLQNLPDLERILARIYMSRASVYDILSLKLILEKTLCLREFFYEKYGINNLPENITKILSLLNFNYDIYDKIFSSISEYAPNSLNEGGVIKENYHPKIDEMRSLILNAKEHIENLRLKYQKITSIENLKINHNNIIGMFIEVTNKHLDKMQDSIFIHKQSTANSARFITDELKELEYKIQNANSILIALENSIFKELCEFISEESTNLNLLSISINQLDLFSSFGFLSEENNYVMPEIFDDFSLEIIKGRHVVVEESLKLKHQNFIPNNCVLDENIRLWLITGPNMGGKSTFLRQNALTVILTQAGCFAPASECKIGVIDKILSRIGSADELSSGQSTFMVEMVETAAILSQATEKSLIILDEVGRGTSTYDGMAIARSIIEYIFTKLKCRCLFSTHYHELTDIASSVIGIKNYTMSIEEVDNKIVFLHKVKEGTADKSYGIHVAELAGLPRVVIEKATYFLSKFEKTKEVKNLKLIQNEQNIDIFNINNEKIKRLNELEEILSDIKKVNPDLLSPRESLEILYKLVNDLKNI